MLLPLNAIVVRRALVERGSFYSSDHIIIEAMRFLAVTDYEVVNIQFVSKSSGEAVLVCTSGRS